MTGTGPVGLKPDLRASRRSGFSPTEADPEWLARRRALVPATIIYPEELPVARERERILATLRDHQVLVLAGDTGSGKTTQLPKLCLELGRGLHGMIGHTQPRRIAAQAVAARVAEELGTTGDSRVAAQIRFQDRSTPDTLVKVMTDGILLAEVTRDRKLRRYDTLIIDEAHERSLNIDFLLGYLKRLLPERPDLKLVITSATIDVERFSRHFGNAPVIEVSGRTYPVEVWYRQPPEEEPDLPQAIVGAIGELLAHERTTPHAGRGDILVFHAGERDIRESALAIRRSGIPNLEVLPLYSRLPQAEQQRVLRPATRAGRRVVLATNVAETSLTVPGIRYVIDPGLARLSRYSVRSKVQRLPIEPVSQASAEQRKGRCGRLSDGICVRLYSEQDFAGRPAFTDPEILRTNLAAVVLQMHALGLGEVGRFPFLEPPEERQVNDGVRLLEELGALAGRKLTDTGRKLARLPVDPRIGRMLLVGAERGALAEMLVIASFLSIQDPRERPPEKQQAADQSHRRFACETSDFVAMLNLWAYAEEQRQALSASAWRRLCQREFLSWLRMREWRDIHLQLRLLGRELGLRENHEAAHPEAVHRAIVAGMLTHIGTRTEERDYEGVRSRRFAVHPGSSLFRKQPKWLVAAELVETTRLYARHCAAIQPEWIFPYADPLVKREHHSPHWSARAGKVLATESVRLFGLLVSDQRKVDFARIDPPEARRLFVQSALVEGDYRSKQRFWEHNRALLAEIEELEARGRRRDLLVEDRVLFDWYDERLPAEVCDHPTLEKWLQREIRRQPAVLCMPRELLLRSVADEPAIAQFPDALEWDGLRVPLAYRYEPGNPADGVTAVLPLALLERFPQHLPEWLVPGLLRDKLIALLKALPKQYRKALVPVPDTVDMLLGALKPADRSLADAVAELLRERLRLAIPREAWSEQALDPFYRMNLRLVATDGTVVAEGRDLAALRTGWIGRSRGEVQRAAPAQLAREGISAWDFGALPTRVTVKGAGLDVPAFPVLRDRGESVAIEALTDEQAAAAAHRAGTRRLLLLGDRQGVAWLRRNVLRDARAVLALGQRIERAALVEDLLLAAAGDCLPADGVLLPRDEKSFAVLAATVKAQLAARAQELERLLARISTELQSVAAQRRVIEKPLFASARADIDAQLERLLAPGFLAATPPAWRERLPVYVTAIAQRMERIGQRLARDQECTRELAALQARLDAWWSSGKAVSAAREGAAVEYRWMLEEYRISLFAQQLGTRGAVSRKRLDKLWETVLL